MVDTANCLPWVTGPTLTYPCCQCVLPKDRIELANWNSDWLVWLIVTEIYFLASKFISVAVMAEAKLTIHPRLSVSVGLLPWYAVVFTCISLFYLCRNELTM